MSRGTRLRRQRRALLRMVTGSGARTLGIEAEYGLVPGRRADLVLITDAHGDLVFWQSVADPQHSSGAHTLTVIQARGRVRAAHQMVIAPTARAPRLAAAMTVRPSPLPRS